MIRNFLCVDRKGKLSEQQEMYNQGIKGTENLGFRDFLLVSYSSTIVTVSVSTIAMLNVGIPMLGMVPDRISGIHIVYLFPFLV